MKSRTQHENDVVMHIVCLVTLWFPSSNIIAMRYSVPYDKLLPNFNPAFELDWRVLVYNTIYLGTLNNMHDERIQNNQCTGIHISSSILLHEW